MNRRDLDAMRQRLAARAAADAEDHPAALAALAVLAATVFFVAFFI